MCVSPVRGVPAWSPAWPLLMCRPGPRSQPGPSVRPAPWQAGLKGTREKAPWLGIGRNRGPPQHGHHMLWDSWEPKSPPCSSRPLSVQWGFRCEWLPCSASSISSRHAAAHGSQETMGRMMCRLGPEAQRQVLISPSCRGHGRGAVPLLMHTHMPHTKHVHTLAHVCHTPHTLHPMDTCTHLHT